MSSIARAQAPATTSSGASTSSKSSVKVEMVPSLFVMNARGANLQGQTLTLGRRKPDFDCVCRPAGESRRAPADRGAAGGMDHRRLRQRRPECHRIGAQQGWCLAHDVVVELRSPRLEGDRLTFDVRVLEGDLAGADGPAAVFVDIIGLPFTPLSFAGVARRTARRAYWYGAAAAPYYRPYGYPGYYPPPYGPYPYPY